MELNRKTARQILKELDLDPVRDLAELAKKSKSEYDKLVEVAQGFSDPECMIEALKVVNEAKKIQIKTLRDLSSICEKEDDQAIRLLDHQLRQDEFAYKKERHLEEIQDSDKQIVYHIPTITKQIGKDGKVKLQLEQEED